MTNKDFIKLALALRNCRGDFALNRLWQEHVNAIAQICSESSSRFDRKKFYEACGISQP